MKFIFFVIGLLLLGAIDLQAQINSNTVSAGGVSTGTGGTITYSIGQVDDIRATGTGGTILQGVQQPFEIFVVSGVEETGIGLVASVFPNPTANILTLSIINSNLQQIKYKLFDVNGKLLSEQNINEEQTSVEMTGYASGSYFLSVLNNNKELKTFKFILTP